MFPIINIGPFAIQASGIILLLSLLIGLWLTSKFAERLDTAGDVIESSVFYGLLAGIAAARIGFLLKNPSIFAEAPLSLFSLTPTMLDPSFGLLVGGLTAFIYAQKQNLPLLPTLDTLTPLVIFVFAGLHFADLANGDRYGLPTNLPWGIRLWNEVRHPVQIYVLLLVFILFLWLIVHTKGFKSTGFMRSGVLFNVLLTGLSMISLFTRAFVAQKNRIGRFDVPQVFALSIIILGLITIYSLKYKSRKRVSVMLSLGSNQDPLTNLSAAMTNIEGLFRVRQVSSQYQTEGVKDVNKNAAFINQVIEIETDLPYPELISQLKQIERGMGRVQENREYIPIDLDIITYNKDVFTTDSHKIPDPDLQRYRYIALPLAEIAPDFRHPANGRTIDKILTSMEDTSQVMKLAEVENGPEG